MAPLGQRQFLTMKLFFSREGAVSMGEIGLFIQQWNWFFSPTKLYQTNFAQDSLNLTKNKQVGLPWRQESTKHFFGFRPRKSLQHHFYKSLSPTKLFIKGQFFARNASRWLRTPLHSIPRNRLAIKATSTRYYAGSVLEKQDANLIFCVLLNAKLHSSQDRTANRE